MQACRAVSVLLMLGCTGKTDTGTPGTSPPDTSTETGTAPSTPPMDLQCTEQADNVLRFDCTAVTTATARARYRHDTTKVEHVGPWVEGGPWTLWGLEAGATYHVQLEALVDGVVQDTDAATTLQVGQALGPSRPAPFDQLTIRAATRPGGSPPVSYVAAPVQCGPDQAVVVVNSAGDLVWYQHVPSGTVTGMGVTEEGLLQLGLDARTVTTWTMDGQIAHEVDYGAEACDSGVGPCPHHDVMQSADGYWALEAVLDADNGASGLSGCEDKTEYAVDHLVRYDDDGLRQQTIAFDLDLGYEPDVDLGPNHDPDKPDPACESSYYGGVLGDPDPPISYTHTNALWIDDSGLYASLKQWDQLLAIDPDDSSLVWRLHASDPDYSDFATPIGVAPSIVDNAEARFANQHHVTRLDQGWLQILDNLGGSGSRVLRISLDEAGSTALIEEAYAVVDDDDGTWQAPSLLSCPNRGSAYAMETGVLTACPDVATVVFLDQPDGTVTAGPAWSVAFHCGENTAVGLYRAPPLATLWPE